METNVEASSALTKGSGKILSYYADHIPLLKHKLSAEQVL